MGAASAVMDSAPICRGAERAELKGKALDSPLDIGWSQMRWLGPLVRRLPGEEFRAG